MVDVELDGMEVAILLEFYISDDPALISTELIDHLDVSRQAIHERLTTLQEKDMLNSKKPGRDRIYWTTELGRRRAEEARRER